MTKEIEQNPEPAETDPASPSKRSPPQGRTLKGKVQLSVASVAAVAGIISAVAALTSAGTGVFDRFSDDDGSQERSSQVTGPPNKVVVGATLAGDGPFIEVANDECKETYLSDAFAIRVKKSRTFCEAFIPDPRVPESSAVRIDSTVRFVGSPDGDLSLLCRGAGEKDNVSAYFGGVTNFGRVLLLKYEGGAQIDLKSKDLGYIFDADSWKGAMRLDCIERPNGAVSLILYLDGRAAASFTDNSPLPRGDVGVSAAAWDLKKGEPWFIGLFEEIRVSVN